MFKRFCLLSLCLPILAGCSLAPRSQLTIDEHLLSGPPDISTDQLVFHFAQGDQEAILARTRQYRDMAGEALAYDQRELGPLGYSLKIHQTPQGSQAIDIFHGDQLIAKDVITMRPVSLNASGTDFIGMADRSDGTYLFTRELFEVPQWYVGRQPYAYVGNHILSVELTHVSAPVSGVSVYLDDTPVYQSQFNNVSTYVSFDGPWVYDGHWVLALLDARGSTAQGWEPLDRLILDGQDVNTLKGYGGSFDFALLDGRPFYFYLKDGKVGISFDGQEISKDYNEIPHYACCIDGLLNPGKSMNMVWFFARRGSNWYYVEAYLPAAP